MREMLVRALSTKYKVYEAKDGLQASELITQIPPPSLIVCDVMMPRVDGFEFARRMRGKKELARVPLIFLTAKTGVSDIVEGINSGARHYLPKPFKLADLLTRVKKILETNR